VCKRIQMDGAGKITIKGDQVYVDATSGGEQVLEAWPLDAAMAMVSDFLQQLSDRDGRAPNIVAFMKKVG
jgi:hypothetical protein